MDCLSADQPQGRRRHRDADVASFSAEPRVGLRRTPFERLFYVNELPILDRVEDAMHERERRAV